MSQSGYTPIQLYRTTTATTTPLAGNLVAGELAINTTDEKLYFKNTAGTVKLLASSAGASGSVTSVDVSGGTTGLSFSGGPVTSSGTITMAGTLGVANGGTGQTSYTNGQLLIGNTTGNTLTKATLTAGTNVSITNGAGSITINATDQYTGTVTSVAASGGTTGLTFTGSPITTSGTLTLGGTLGVANGGTGATTLTSGYLTKGNGAYPLSASVVYDNGTNVGIGTSSPSYKLDVAGDIALKNNATYLYGKTTGGAATRMLGINGGNDLYFGSIDAAVSNINFTNNGTVQAVLTSSGNLGIGTSSPVSKLQVNAASTGTAFTVSSSGVGVQALGAYLGSGVAYWADSGALNGMGVSTASNYVNFLTNNTERMRIDASGSVLIGKSAVSGLGEILGVNRASDGTTAMIGRSGGTYNPYARFIATDASALTTIDANSSAGTPQLAFSTNSTERMRLDGSGNVGVGTTTPAAKLNVVGGDIKVDASTRWIGYWEADTVHDGYMVPYNGSGQVELVSSFTSGGILFKTGTGKAERMRIDSSGNVGIGLSNPATFGRLAVNGSATASIVVATNVNGTTGSPAETQIAGAAYGGSGASQAGMYSLNAFASTSAHYLSFKTTSSANITAERMRIDDAGNVGIGTTSPSNRLQVSGGRTYLRYDVADDNPLVVLNTSATGYGPYFQGGAGVRYAMHVTDYAGTSRLIVQGGGNVGIGTTDPPYKLTVSNGGADGLEIGPGYSPGYVLLQAYNRATAAYSYMDSVASLFRWQISGVEKMRLDTSGNLGIGTSSAVSKLHVNTPTGAIYSTTGNNAGGTQIGVDTSGVSVVSAYATNAIRFGYNSGSTFVETMRLDASGNVGLGVTPSGANLPTIQSTYGLFTGSSQINVAGNAYYNGGWKYVNTAAASLYFQGSGAHNWQIAPSGTAGAAVGFTQAMTLDASGNLLVGTTSAFGKVASVTTTSGLPAVFCRGLTDARASSTTQTSGTSYFDYFTYNGTAVGSITSTGTTTAYNTTSDARLKENIADADDASALVDSIKIRKFDWKASGEHQRHGVIAQELMEVAPEAVTPGRTEDDMMSVDYSKLVPMLIKEVQSLRARVAQLEGK